MKRLTNGEVEQVGGGEVTDITPVQVGDASPYPYPYPSDPCGIPAFSPAPMTALD